MVATKVVPHVRASYQRSPKFLNRTFSLLQRIVVDGEETGSFPIELPRFKRVIKAIAFAMYYMDFGKRNEGDFEVFSTSLRSRSDLYHGTPDGHENLRQILAGTSFKSMPVSQPKVFKYGMSRPGEGQIHYRFEFYEGFVVYALSLRHRLNQLIYLPVTSDLLVFRRANE